MGRRRRVAYWEVQLTLRDEQGDRRREVWGTFSLDGLPTALEEAFQRAGNENGGVQVIRREGADRAEALSR